MVFVRPQEELQETNGQGVILNLDCFIEDPEGKTSAQPDLYYQTLIAAPNAAQVTADMIEDAIAAAMPDIKIQIAPKKEAPAAAKAALGKVFDLDAVAEKSAQRRAAKGGR